MNILKPWQGKGCILGDVYCKDSGVSNRSRMIQARSVGGEDTYKNIQLLHRHCHDVKTAEDLKAVNFLNTL